MKPIFLRFVYALFFAFLIVLLALKKHDCSKKLKEAQEAASIADRIAEETQR